MVPLELRNTLVFILAGGSGSRLMPLTENRAKPAVPFGGSYRIIDFTLSNCIHSGLRRIHLRPEAPDRWSVDHRWGPVRLRGTVQVAPTGLHLELTGGELGTASSAAAEVVSLATGGTHGAGLSPTSLALAELF